MPVPLADDAFFHPPPPTRVGRSFNATSNKWGPYSGAGDFGAGMAIVLASLFSTVLLALALGAAVRLLLRRLRRGPPDTPEKPAAPPPAASGTPTTWFSAAGTKLAGAEAECAICLTEFVEGDAVRVLPACSHGFHVRCIDRWLAGRSSCPTCRACCGVNSDKAEQTQSRFVVERV
ncbi:hypothetical protein C4D60_Mb06t37460 [Musa balbisiana]|uniref:RING-type domain-containing protein n=1 Tax=Musa balbisiana TaxID=52838 RepID=A0A4S8ITL6_MUSBA|nr:hypothetical protein C4D60_Mb06t37460 [Musa balbisiana]